MAKTNDRRIPPIQFADAQGARLAYQSFGDGPHTIVSIPPTAQNIELSWERPEITAMFDRFASFSRFIHFDKRGTGSSGRRTTVNGIDERVDDLRDIMDAAGVERAVLYVSSEGGPMALLFAATYPERVEGLILNGTGASMVREDMTESEREAARVRYDQFARVWGTPESPVVARFAPSLAGDAEFCLWHQRYERHASTPESLRELLELSLDMDVHEILPELDVPTLVIHRTGDQVVPVEFGRELADKIPGARIFEQPGQDHFAYAGDMDGWMDEMERFVTGSVSPRPVRVQPSSPAMIVTLGGFGVEVDGDPVPISAWGSRRARQLCKRLVAARAWPVTRDELIDILWPDETDMGRLGARLSVQLSAVRRILGGAVIADRQAIRLDLDAVSTDLEGFYGADTDQEIVDAYTGEFLPEDKYEDWTAGVRDETRARFITSARRIGTSAINEGDASTAAAMAHRLIALDRYDGEAHRLVLRAHMSAGETREAERAYQTWAAAFDELGLDVPPLAVVGQS